MSAFLQSIIALPTVLFTGVLGLALLYWCLVFLGALDIDALDIDIDLDVDVDADGMLDGALDGAVEGAMDGAGEAADGALDGADDAANVSVLAQLLGVLRVRDVPITVSLSFMALFSWCASWLLSRFAGPFLGQALPELAVAAAVFVAAIVVAIPVGRLAVRPMSGLFHTNLGARRADVIGQMVEITTGRVDQRFGQAEIATDGADLLVQVRADPAVALARGEQALIVSWDAAQEAYVVEPLRQPGAAAHQTTADPSPQPEAAPAPAQQRDPDTA